MTDDRWPALPYDAWKDTYATLHMWTQVVGKVTLALAPAINHSWGIAFHLTPRGWITPLLAYGDRSFTIAFDFVEHQLSIDTSDDRHWTMPLRPMTVADFYRDVMKALSDLSMPVKIWSM